MIPGFRYKVLSILFTLLIACCLTGADTGDDAMMKKTQALVLVYMVGSDLESGSQAATDDIREMITGYGTGSAEKVDILVAYGGSALSGWDGMTIATIRNLTEDAHDGIIGNEELYEFRNPVADMGSGDTLSQFLTFATSQYNAEMTYLILWDHGSAYEGFGLDELTGNQISLTDLTSALETSNTNVSLIGFDACLMGTIEVAAAIAPHAQYLVASEELEPGSGWSYGGWLSVLLQDPGIDPVTIGKAMVDSFMETNDPGKTLSVIDLSRIPDLLSSLDRVGKGLSQDVETPEGFRSLGRAYSATTRFGEIPRESAAMTVDLLTLIQLLSSGKPERQKAVLEVEQILKEMILYERHDEYIGNATGLAILSPGSLDSTTYLQKGQSVQIGPAWDSFLTSLLIQQGQDTSRPTLVADENGLYQLEDPYNSAYVSVEYYWIEKEGLLLQIGSDQVDPDPEGRYILPNWDGTWFYLQDGDNPENYALLEMYYEEMTSGGGKSYSSDIDLNRAGKTDSALLNTYTDPATGEFLQSINPYTIRDNGDVTYSRSTLSFEPGDQVTTYAWEYNPESDQEDQVVIGEMNITPKTRLIFDILPDGTYAEVLYAEYGNHQGDYTSMRTITVENGTITSIEDIPMGESNTFPIIPGEMDPTSAVSANDVQVS
ncbi:MAG TPA: clostripain-related cysteine peptidase [Methanospirillum sp.]|nr:clostripain-related cysteine peptidase [Methanospirillum sp.]